MASNATPVDVSLQRSFYTPWVITGYVTLGITLAVLAVLTWINFKPLWESTQVPTVAEEKITLPEYDLSYWRAQAVLHDGRYKPFETASLEIMRQITGRAKFQSYDSSAVVLSWIFSRDPKLQEPVTAWDKTAFVLCEHKDLRRLLYSMLVDDKGKLLNEEDLGPDGNLKLHGKYVAPQDVRTFRLRLEALNRDDPARFTELTRPIERQLDELLRRETVYESLSVKPRNDVKSPHDPLAIIALDQAPHAAWFTLGELRKLQEEPKQWLTIMQARVKDTPHTYIKPEHKQSLDEFQKQLASGTTSQAIATLEAGLQERRSQPVEKYELLLKANKAEASGEYLAQLLFTWPIGNGDEKAKKRWVFHVASILRGNDATDMPLEVANELRGIDRAGLTDILKKEKADPRIVLGQLQRFLSERDQLVIQDLKARLPLERVAYDKDDPKYRMLHLVYLETRFPEMYKEAISWQKVPTAAIARVLASHAELGEAYRGNDAGKFDKATKDFFATCKDVSEHVVPDKVTPYPGDESLGTRLGLIFSGQMPNPPGEDLLALEQTFNRAKPFMWAWVLMLLALLLFCVSLGLNNQVCYWLGWALACGSLAYQFFGFFTRVAISGRAPVTNMYETVIWVGFMSGIFALILEAIYRRKVIAIAGAMVATISLVLADQMPLALDPRVNPLVPVLRSNFWLTIHVLTIVSSYAGASLAWGLGNVTLFLIVFGWSSRDTIKMLTTFTYRAMQIAVLLLAAGTFLGGWWAAYSWGRFWGWDAKETGALVALVVYVIPLHMRFIGWIREYGMAVAGVLCYAMIMIAWYGINFLFPAGLHAYGQGAGGETWFYWGSVLNIAWLLIASLKYHRKQYDMEMLKEASSLPVSSNAPVMAASEHIKA